MADLAARAREVDRLSQRIIPLLPTPLREHVVFAGLRHDRVLLLIESPVWATRARMEQAHILAVVHSLGLAATSVTTRVVPLPAPTEAPASARQLSPRAVAAVRAAANTIQDPELRAVFEELANHAATPTA